ncbi:MAG: hypothetical protein ACREHG_09495 [Candidatus Saccharimonadales bacterium]
MDELSHQSRHEGHRWGEGEGCCRGQDGGQRQPARCQPRATAPVEEGTGRKRTTSEDGPVTRCLNALPHSYAIPSLNGTADSIDNPGDVPSLRLRCGPHRDVGDVLQESSRDIGKPTIGIEHQW